MDYKEGKHLPNDIKDMNVSNIVIKHRNNSVYLKEVRYNERFLYLDGVKYPYKHITYNIRRDNKLPGDWFKVFLEIRKY